MAEPLALKDHSGESQVFFDRIVLGLVLLVIGLMFLAARMFYLQIMQHDIYTTLSDKNRIQVQSVPPIRGLIYDRNGELIADNVPSFSLTITRERVEDLESTLKSIDALIGLTPEQIESFQRRLSRRQRPYEAVPILLRMTQEQIAQISVNRYSFGTIRMAT